ncbi:MAG TPA: DUF4230 domain-containing protein [Verrucomicrobiae bacterium]|nr:DUF4230 domain-containing protein [Verrucomicrobiae bacterium]
MRKSRSTFFLVGVAIVFIAGIWFGNKLPGWLGDGRKVYSSATLLLEVKPLAQLVTVQYVVQKYVEQVDAKWYGDNHVMLLAQGVVTAGIDLKQLQDKDIEVSGTNVIVHLPPAQIMDAHLDDKETRVVDRTTGIWRTFDKDLEQETRKIAVDDIRRDARTHGILEKADAQAKLLLANLFHQLGFTSIVFEGATPVSGSVSPDK